MAVITLRADVDRLKGLWAWEHCRDTMLQVLGACGFDDDFINDISNGEWSLRKEVIGKKLKKAKRGWETE